MLRECGTIILHVYIAFLHSMLIIFVLMRGYFSGSSNKLFKVHIRNLNVDLFYIRNVILLLLLLKKLNIKKKKIAHIFLLQTYLIKCLRYLRILFGT